MKMFLFFVSASLVFISPAMAEPPNVKPVTRDIVFATVDGHQLRLDLFFPKEAKNAPLVVFIHGGGWRNGSYKRCLVPWLTEYGFAVASIGYRLSDKAVFPAQIHDCKAAVRWLRAHDKEYPYDATRVAVSGTSAGGYLALMLGVTNGSKELEGDVGGNLDQSSQVQAVVDYYGPADFVLRSKNQPVKTEAKGSPVRSLLGTPASKNLKLAEYASPVSHVTKDAPPLLIIHGDNDKTVYLDQSQRMVEAYKKAERDVTLKIVMGGGHGGSAHFSKEKRNDVVEFLKQHLQSTSD